MTEKQDLLQLLLQYSIDYYSAIQVNALIAQNVIIFYFFLSPWESDKQIAG